MSATSASFPGVSDTGYSSSTAYWSAMGTSQANEINLYKNISAVATTYQTVRPSRPTTVTPWFTLLKTLSLSTSGVFSVTGLMVLGWIDQRLAWTPANYSNVQQLNLLVDEMWYPSVSLLNSANPGAITPGSSTTAILYYTGLVYLYIPSLFTAFCTLSLNHFPYDTQTCNLQFVSYDTNTSVPGVVFTTNSNDTSLPLQYYSDTGEYELTSGSLVIGDEFCVSSCFSTFNITLNYSRRSSYYTTTVIVPAMLLTFLLALTLIIPSENSIKINVACTLMVSLYTLQQTVARLLPATQSPPMLSIGMVCSLALAAFCAVCSIFSVIARMLQPNVGAHCGSYLDYLSFLICLPRKPKRVIPAVEENFKMPLADNFQPPQFPHNEASNKENEGVLTTSERRMLADIASTLTTLSRSSREVMDKKIRDNEQTRRWRIMDSIFNIGLFVIYLVIAITCVTLYDFYFS